VQVVEPGSKARLAKELGVSRASLYYQRKIPEKDEELRRRIEVLMEQNPGYGSPRVAIALKINKKRAARVMKKFGLKPARRCKVPRKPGDEGRAPLSHLNILGRLSPIAPNVVWASDFTFILYNGAFIYLCTVIDMFTGEVLGFNISRRHDAAFVRLAIERAFRKTGARPSWFHSDQGSEYASEEVQTWLIQQDIIISMNPKGAPWCNGSQESFFGRFKVEFGDFQRFNTYADLLEELYSQLNYFSNLRIKTKLKMAPSEFRRQWEDNFSKVIHSLSVSPVPPLPPRPNTHRAGCAALELASTAPLRAATATSFT
jgi:transposase InsO family protein